MENLLPKSYLGHCHARLEYLYLAAQTHKLCQSNNGAAHRLRPRVLLQSNIHALYEPTECHNVWPTLALDADGPDSLPPGQEP